MDFGKGIFMDGKIYLSVKEFAKLAGITEQTLQKESAQQFVQQFTNLLKTELETKRERISTLELQVQKKQWWKFWERRAEG